MGFDERYYEFIENLNPHQAEAFNDVSRLFEDVESSLDVHEQDTCRELPEAAESARTSESSTLKSTIIPNTGNSRYIPILDMDETGVIMWRDPQYVNENGKKKKFRCPANITSGRFAGQQCFNYAGYKTDHYGIGFCIAHGGAKRKGRAHAGWIFMHAISKALNISPWDALLGQIRLLAGQVAWLTEKVGESAQHDDDLLPDGQAFFWMELLEQRGERLAKVSKMAIDAGIAERMVTMMENQATILNNAVKAAALKLNYDEQQEYELITTIAREYQAIEQNSH